MDSPCPQFTLIAVPQRCRDSSSWQHSSVDAWTARIGRPALTMMGRSSWPPCNDDEGAARLGCLVSAMQGQSSWPPVPGDAETACPVRPAPAMHGQIFLTACNADEGTTRRYIFAVAVLFPSDKRQLSVSEPIWSGI